MKIKCEDSFIMGMEFARYLIEMHGRQTILNIDGSIALDPNFIGAIGLSFSEILRESIAYREYQPLRWGAEILEFKD